MKHKKSIILSVIVILVCLLFSSCDVSVKEYQNQFFEKQFGISFISTEYSDYQRDALSDYLLIELDESEQKQMEEFIKEKDFFSKVSDKNENYKIMNKKIKENFTKCYEYENAYFALYLSNYYGNIVTLDTVSIKQLYLDDYNMIIYDCDTGNLHVYRHSQS